MSESFASRILDFLEPEPSRQSKWVGKREMEPPTKAPEFEALKKRLMRAKKQNEKVFVGGDYDTDGMMATTLMVDLLNRLGIENGYYIPNRIEEGYGLSEHIVEMAYERGYSLIITVDNGVKAHEALKKAKELGMEVIVTDHHSYEQEPDALMMLHPFKMEEAFHTLCGAALVFEILRYFGLDERKHLHWAMVASIGDCMEVTGQTRSIIQEGLASICQYGDLHLIPLAGKDQINETDVSFQIVPKINSIGRLANQANANTFVRYLLSDNPAQIQRYQKRLEDLNTQRKSLSNQQLIIATGQIKPYKPVLIACSDAFHEGIVGIVAGQLAGTYKKPTIIAKKTGDICKASMRAPKGFNCMEFLKDFPHFSACGGHEQAAGFSVPVEYWSEFEEYCMQKGREYLWSFEPKASIPISVDEITMSNVRSLDILRPFGPGFEMPNFVLENPEIKSVFDLSRGQHRKFTLKNGIECLNFNQSQLDIQNTGQKISSFSGSMQLNSFRNRKSVNFIIDEIEYTRN